MKSPQSPSALDRHRDFPTAAGSHVQAGVALVPLPGQRAGPYLHPPRRPPRRLPSGPEARCHLCCPAQRGDWPRVCLSVRAQFAREAGAGTHQRPPVGLHEHPPLSQLRRSPSGSHLCSPRRPLPPAGTHAALRASSAGTRSPPPPVPSTGTVRLGPRSSAPSAACRTHALSALSPPRGSFKSESRDVPTASPLGTSQRRSASHRTRSATRGATDLALRHSPLRPHVPPRTHAALPAPRGPLHVPLPPPNMYDRLIHSPSLTPLCTCHMTDISPDPTIKVAVPKKENERQSLTPPLAVSLSL